MVATKLALEICAGSVQSCIAAEQGGANRIELCDNLYEGGTTPSAGTITMALKVVNIPIYPIIRPRGGDFLYSEWEYEVMKKDIQFCKEAGCAGVVIGLLRADGQVDAVRTKELVALAAPMGVTFHRAFDMSADPIEALETIIACGCERILTSGAQQVASSGVELLKTLVDQAGDRIEIMIGSGVRANNVAELAQYTKAKAFHTTARSFEESPMVYRNPNVSMGGIPNVPEYGIPHSQKELVAEIRGILNGIESLI
jgi:copper homeostasis protein